MSSRSRQLPRYVDSMAGSLLAAREAVMAPLRPALREANVTEQQWRILRVLADIGPADCTAIARATLLHPPSVTRIARELTARGLVARGGDAADARRALLSITDEGRDIIATTSQHTVRVLHKQQARFGLTRFNDLLSELQEFTHAISEENLTD